MLTVAMLSLLTAQAEVVQADVVNVRQSPSSHGEVAARLRINTPVTVEAARGQWVQIGVPGRPDEHALTGWVHADLLGPGALTVRDALDQHAAAETAADRLTWAERATALAPHDRDALALLRDAALEAGDPGRAAAVDGWLAHGRPVQLAVCDGSRALLLGELGADGWQQVPWQPDAALEYARAAASQRWYAASYDAHGLSALDAATPFPAPFLTASNNEESPSPYVPSSSQMGDDSDPNAVLGPCAFRGVLATAPIGSVDYEAVDPDEVFALAAEVAAAASADEEVLGARVVAPVPGLPLREVRLTVRHTWHSCGGEGETGAADTFALTTPSGEVVAGRHATAYGTFLTRTDGAGSWFAIQGVGPIRWIGVYGATEGTWDETTLIAVEGDHVDAVHEATVTTATWGC